MPTSTKTLIVIPRKVFTRAVERFLSGFAFRLPAIFDAVTCLHEQTCGSSSSKGSSARDALSLPAGVAIIVEHDVNHALEFVAGALVNYLLAE
jgi:hypothetical protein